MTILLPITNHIASAAGSKLIKQGSHVSDSINKYIVLENKLYSSRYVCMCVCWSLSA